MVRGSGYCYYVSFDTTHYVNYLFSSKDYEVTSIRFGGYCGSYLIGIVCTWFRMSSKRIFILGRKWLQRFGGEFSKLSYSTNRCEFY